MRNLASLPLLIAIVAAAPLALAKGVDIEKVNGSISTDAGIEYGDLETVNGSISIAKGSKAHSASTVNGRIDVADDVVVGELETVNGSIEIGTGVVVGDDIETVNGAIIIGRDSQVSGSVGTVNGRIELEGAEVGKGLSTVSGNITVGAGSVVRGGIVVDKPGGFFNFGTRKKPRVVIGPDARVEGTLEFRQEVELFVHETASVGEIRGATATRFSGATP